MAILISMKGKYKNENVNSCVIRYITRTRKNEDKRNELLVYGSPNVSCLFGDDGIEQMITEFEDVQRYFCYGGVRGRKVMHETFNLLDEEAAYFTPWEIDALALECSRYYDQMGFQVIYAVHFSESKRLHIHFVVNAISYRTGLKFHSSLHEDKARETMFQEILRKHICINKGRREMAQYGVFFPNYPVYYPCVL